MTIEEYTYWLPLTPEHLTELGRIAAESAQLEGLIEIGIWQTVKIPLPIGEQITSRPGLGQLLPILFTAIETIFPLDDDKTDFKPIREELKAVVTLRNHVIHGHWAFGITPDAPRSLAYKSERGGIFPRTKVWKPSDLQRIAARIGRVGDELIWFLDTRGVELPPPRRKPWKRFQVPPEPKWPSKKNRVHLRRLQPSQP